MQGNNAECREGYTQNIICINQDPRSYKLVLSCWVGFILYTYNTKTRITTPFGIFTYIALRNRHWFNIAQWFCVSQKMMMHFRDYFSYAWYSQWCHIKCNDMDNTYRLPTSSESFPLCCTLFRFFRWIVKLPFLHPEKYFSVKIFEIIPNPERITTVRSNDEYDTLVWHRSNQTTRSFHIGI